MDSGGSSIRDWRARALRADASAPVRGETAAAGPREGAVGSDRSGLRWRRELRNLVELFALSGLAIAQPLLDAFGRAPEHLIFRGADRSDILWFALIATLAVPVAAWFTELLVGVFSTRGRDVLHSGYLLVLAAIALAPILDSVLPRVAALVAALLVAAGFMVLHRRTRGPRIWLAFLSPAPIVFLALFLVASPAAPLLRGSVGALDATVGDPTRTVVVIFDEFPLNHLLDEDGDIDEELFPNFAALAATSHWFRRTATVANTTDAVVPAMFTGMLPDGRPTPSAEVFPDNLFTLVGGEMPIHAAEQLTRFCPPSLCELVDEPDDALPTLLRDARRVLGHRLDPSDPDADVLASMIDEGADEIGSARPATAPDADDEGLTVEELERRLADSGSGRFRSFLDTFDEQPGVHVIHLVLPHAPYRMLPDGTIYPLEDRSLGRRFDTWFADPAPVTVARKRHLLQTQRVDRLVGLLRDDLEARGFWDDTNVVIVADHGVNFTPGDFGRGLRADLVDRALDPDTLLATVAWVPFFVKAAGQTEGVVSDDPIRIVDMLPTIADLLDVEIPWAPDGRSALDGGSGDPDRATLQINDYSDPDGRAGPDRSIGRELAWRILLDESVARFAPSDPPLGDDLASVGSARIFRVGPRPDLWGRPVPADLVELDVDIDERSRADDVDTASGTLPALFIATTDDADAGTDVAIAVNGTIWATTSVHLDEGRRLIADILPVEAFRDGPNELGVHLLPEDPP